MTRIRFAIGPRSAPRRYHFSRQQFIPLPREKVFAFFADAHKLEYLTPPWLRFHITTRGDIAMHDGTLIDYALRLHGVPVTWQSVIRDWTPPHRFIDVQVRGPYQYWAHTHIFEEQDGGTLIRDEIDYDVPFGYLADRLFVRPDLQRIFNYRSQQLLAWAEGTALT